MVFCHNHIKTLAPVVLIVMLGFTTARATPQEGDVLLYQGVKYALYTYPLEEYLYKHPPKPEFDRDAKSGLLRISTGNYRGYRATWRIYSGTLYLIAIESVSGIQPADLFPGHEAPVPAFWYTGELRVPTGEILVTSEYHDPRYDEELYIEIHKGKVVGQNTIEITDAQLKTER